MAEKRLNAAEKLLVKVLEASKGNMAEVSRKLDISYPTLVANLHRMGIDHNDYKPKPKKKARVTVVKKKPTITDDKWELNGGKGKINFTKDVANNEYIYITTGFGKYVYLNSIDAGIVKAFLDKYFGS